MSDDIYINIDDEQPKPVDVVQVEFDKQDVYIDVQQDYAPVLSVNGQVGYVNLTPENLGLNNIVYTTGNQNIGGVKTFASRPTVNGTGVLLSGESLTTVQILNTTYSTLTGLKATNSLLSGQLYRISDFVLKWNNQSINDQTVKTAASGEPLIVTALSNNTIHPIARSEIYPQDTVYYNIDATSSYSWGTINNNLAIPDFKGWIYRRVDNFLNIDISYDWRNITVNCCKPDVSSVPNYSPNVQYSRLDYVKETGNNSNRGKLFYSIITGNFGNVLSNHNAWIEVSDFVESGTYFATDESFGWSALYDLAIYLPFITGSRIQQPTFVSTLTGLGVFYMYDVHDVKIQGGHSNVIFGAGFFNNTIENDFNNNTIGPNFRENKIGNNFENNVIGINFRSNTIANGFVRNVIGHYMVDNRIGNTTQFNTIGSLFFNNTLGSTNMSNVIGNYFSNNTIGNQFLNNRIANNFYENTIGATFYYNAIGDWFINNTIGSAFQSNTIKDNFRYNTVEAFFDNVNFLNATRVYGTYNTTLFKNSANVKRLRYFDENDRITVTSPTD